MIIPTFHGDLISFKTDQRGSSNSEFLTLSFFSSFILSDSSVNVLQIEISDKDKSIEEVIGLLKTKTLYLKLKSYRIEKNISQYVFWFDVKKNDINSFIKLTENLKKEQENISIHVYSRTGIYE